nr:ORF6N domain-containing protein [uncultured Blautia sp.]
MNELKVTGSQKFMGKEIPVVAGGFGKKEKCVSDKTVAEIHGMNVFDVRRRITDNIKRFKENIDYIDLIKRMREMQTLKECAYEASTLELLQSLGYAKQSISQAEHIYILSERGYAKLIKIMDTDLAWEIHDKLMDEYFQMKEEKKRGTLAGEPKRPALSSVNMMVKNITGTLQKAGVDDLYIAAEVKRIYTDAGYPVNAPLITDKETMPKLYDCTEMAKELGIYSTGGKPHSQAVGAIIKNLDVPDSEIVKTAFSRNGHEDVTVQYKPSVLESVKVWMEERDYPTKISYVNSKGRLTTCTVSYQEVS